MLPESLLRVTGPGSGKQQKKMGLKEAPRE
jgi:hypothetical protein